ncbi:hypothetical protein [Dyella kyungheensis]|uniref:Uncharacterized protein n=1 Tax=Dyella kyungheensis TaxID=1242174 RepID=A0ABS2JXN5_9GAMM|nr:hypothetical protein [Dyella kyungheensis]MBM7123100.1 hypothetical protein [Dyella kyungheensis]
MDTFDPAAQVSDAMREEAKLNPNGWVYVITGSYGPNDGVPPEAIMGAWKVDGAGTIIDGSFLKNPKYKG